MFGWPIRADIWGGFGDVAHRNETSGDAFEDFSVFLLVVGFIPERDRRCPTGHSNVTFLD